MANTLNSSQVRVGYLIDGRRDTPFQAATLTYETGQGPLLTVPYVLGSPQFAETEKWFVNRVDLPESLLFWDGDGMVTLLGLRWGGHSFAQAAVGRVVPQTVIFGRPRQLKAAYTVRRLTSRIDGLQDFTSYSSIDVDYRGTNALATATVNPNEEVSWRHGGFSYTISAAAPWSGSQGQSFTAESASVLKSTRARRASIAEHVRAQRPMRALLILALTAKLSWREHWVTDRQFPTWFLDGSTADGHLVQVLTRQTVADAGNPEPKSSDFGGPLFHLADLGSAGLTRWFRLYDDAVFRRAIEPTVEVINGASRFLEPQLLMTAMALEAMGHYRDPQRRPKIPVESQVKRCLDATRFDFTRIGSNKAIARAVARTYNDLKHPDRDSRPDGYELSLLTPLALLVLRMQLFDLLRMPMKVRTRFERSNAVYRALEPFRLNGVTIDSRGNLCGAT